jgi:hypothetical protein
MLRFAQTAIPHMAERTQNDASSVAAHPDEKAGEVWMVLQRLAGIIAIASIIVLESLIFRDPIIVLESLISPSVSLLLPPVAILYFAACAFLAARVGGWSARALGSRRLRLGRRCHYCSFISCDLWNSDCMERGCSGPVP